LKYWLKKINLNELGNTVIRKQSEEGVNCYFRFVLMFVLSICHMHSLTSLFTYSQRNLASFTTDAYSFLFICLLSPYLHF
jgi:hypothetical protein